MEATIFEIHLPHAINWLYRLIVHRFHMLAELFQNLFSDYDIEIGF